VITSKKQIVREKVEDQQNHRIPSQHYWCYLIMKC